ncbi:hypothetical protein BJ944DRAFT_265545 [Cunninghamella echinulata]|nr:hypothetical protein BJ944DRAFT_265545 [Cunninghamella echinulata]
MCITVEKISPSKFRVKLVYHEDVLEIEGGKEITLSRCVSEEIITKYEDLFAKYGIKGNSEWEYFNGNVENSIIDCKGIIGSRTYTKKRTDELRNEIIKKRG